MLVVVRVAGSISGLLQFRMANDYMLGKVDAARQHPGGALAGGDRGAIHLAAYLQHLEGNVQLI